MPSPTGPFRYRPASSGPRWTRLSRIAESRDSATGAPSPRRTPTMPHMARPRPGLYAASSTRGAREGNAQRIQGGDGSRERPSSGLLFAALFPENGFVELLVSENERLILVLGLDHREAVASESLADIGIFDTEFDFLGECVAVL